jgi:hypothetical protein
MKLLFVGLSVCLLASGPVLAQDEDTLPVGAVLERSVAASPSVTAFRPLGEYRVWRFFSRQTTFGQLSSLVEAETRIDGVPALTLSESLRLDYTLLGGDKVVVTKGETYATPDGKYLGHRLEIGDGQTKERFEVERRGSSLEATYTRGGAELSSAAPYPETSYFWDLQLVDQLEIYLAMHDLEIGAMLEDSIYLPQSLMKTRLAGQVIYYMWQEIYKGKIDSVFIIRLSEPSECQLYFTPDKKLVRVDLINQGIRVYQDLVRMSPVKAERSPVDAQAFAFSWKLLLLKAPHYFVFLLLAALALVLVSTRGFRWKLSYLYLPAGILLYAIMPLAINRLMAGMAGSWLDPGRTGGAAVYFVGLIPPLVLGAIHVGVLGLGIYCLGRWFKVRAYRFSALGAFIGAGFALAEAVHQSGLRIELLFDWPLAARAASIFLYTFAGAVVGRGLAVRGVWAVRYAIAAVVVIGVFRYLPLWVQTGLVDLQAIHFVMVIWVIVFVMAAVTFVKKPIERDQVEAEISDAEV